MVECEGGHRVQENTFLLLVPQVFLAVVFGLMDVKSGQEPLLSRKEDVVGCGKKRPFWVSSAKVILRVVMWVIFITWAAFIFLYPSDFVTDLYQNGVKLRKELCLGSQEKSSKFPRFRLWTFPVLVDGPFGVVSAAEMIGIVLFTAYVVWAFAAYTVKNSELVSWFQLPSRERRSSVGDDRAILHAFLFLPLQGDHSSPPYRYPLEHATRYHVWLGHLTMMLFTLHGLFYVIGWGIEGRLARELMDWKNIGIANLPGVISLLAGLLMWVTSLPGVRRINFELFFYTHQLYVVFVVFLALHVGDFLFCFAAGGIFLFMLDRFLRFCQSRRTVNILSARSFPCGTLELVLSKPANLHYNALGWIFLQVRELSWLQWHPFSVSSSPLDGKHHLAVLIKVLGNWTGRLDRLVSSASEKETETEPLLQRYSKLTASVEGPYGHASPYHLTYENLILVAGGIGISPFLAILSDVLHRLKDGKPCMPKNILIVWAIKTSDELPLLHTVGMESIFPNFSNSLNLEIQTYVTRESQPSLEEGKEIEPSTLLFSPPPRDVELALLDVFYINPYQVTSWWYNGLLFIACMAASVLIFGGLVIGLWHLWERKTSSHECEKNTENGTVKQNEPNIHKDSGKEQYISTTLYGQRPDFRGIFETMSDRWGNVDIGVILCGPRLFRLVLLRSAGHRT
ncbi:UNVERIFIED_CONTAM: Ferric reduction oxidase 7, chloroplastic [Sesamum radiatum]|uniref:Ferric reduction oxidase 7, chloroplastic n=1 Tax=Sesamum radiatum TaxID=300843 RepID=A0AAW2MVH6_SESRA